MQQPVAAGVSDTSARTGSDPLVGKHLGDFVLLERIGSGGFGAIYRAEQSLLDREAVVKVLHTSVRQQPALVQRFLREARLATKLDHPYAAHVYAFGAEPDGLLWIAMELVRGTPLDAVLKAQGPLPLPRFVPFLERVCEVVQAAHDQGIIHRDLKPANVMVLSRSGRILPKLLDFGIAKLARGDPMGEQVAEPAQLPAESGSPALEHLSDATLDSALLQAESVQLTQQGSFIGSPHYMAPEQWLNAGRADARTDIYALGVLSFQALTGSLPFEGSSIRAIAKRHATAALPGGSPQLPEALREVLVKATAKAPQDRFASALELAAAMRAASGVEEEPVSVPQLEEQVRVELIASAPAPLAEAVTQLESVRSPREAVQAGAQLVRAALLYLGALGLACRARVGPGVQGESVPVLEALRRLKFARLDDAGWLDLSRELCRPFAFTRDAHPIPELVSFFFEPGGEKPGPGGRALESVTRSWLPAAAAAAEAELPAIWERGVQQLQVLLGHLAFLSAYTLVVERGRGAESWMGARRGRRPACPVRGHALAPGDVALANSQGDWVLSLSPLVCAMPPTPGAEEELFLFDGGTRHGARLINPARRFECFDETLWDWFRATVGELGESGPAQREEESAPYRGLASFTARDNQNYFGREREAEAFANRLRMQSLLAVAGPSGSGKSSFVQAGVMPLFPSWRFFVVRPGATPIAALAARLEQEGVPSRDFAERLRREPKLLGERLLAASHGHEGVALVVDQFEELITLCGDAEERAAYAQALSAAAVEVERPVRVILTLRDDFMIRCQQLAALRERLGPGLQLLGTPAAAELSRIITEPARRAGYSFDDGELVQQMVQAVADQPGALALLSFTAAQLWELRDRSLKRLTHRAYHALGGVGGALAQHAEATLAQMPPDEQKKTRDAFRSLVTAAGTRAVLSRKELLDILGGDRAAEGALERLIGARLLVSEREAGGERIEVIHETLLTSWPRLVQWQREDAEVARLRDQLRAAARQWDERGRPRGVLWRGDALVEYRLWRARYPGALSESEKAFAVASLRDDSRGRRIRTGLLALAFLLLSAGVGLLFRANQRVGRSAAEARNSLAAMHLEQGRLSLLREQPLQSLPYLSKAYEEGVATPALRHMLARALSATTHQLASMEGHSLSILDMDFSPDDRLLATASRDGTVRLWDVATGRPVGQPLRHPGEVRSVAFSTDGARLLSGCSDGAARIWSIASGQVLREMQGQPSPSCSAAFSPDEGTVLTTGAEGDVRLWNARTGELLHQLPVPRGYEGRPAFSHDGRLAVTHGNAQDDASDTSARIWNVRTGALVWDLKGHSRPVGAVAFSYDDRHLITGSNDGTARLWNLQTGALERVLEGHQAAVTRVSFSPDGRRAATASDDHSARLWDAGDGKLVAALTGHSGVVDDVRFSPDSKWLVTGSDDGTARIWDSETGRPRMTLHGHSDPVWWVRISHDGTRIATMSQDLTVKIWRSESRDALATMPWSGGCAAFSASGAEIWADGPEDTLISWDAASGQKRRTQKLGPTICTALSGDGAQAFTTGTAAAPGRIWDLSTGAALSDLPPSRIEIAAFDPRDRLLATGNSPANVLSLWEVPTGKPLAELDHHGATLAALSWSPDGRLLATAAHDAVADIFDVEHRSRRLSIRGHLGPVLSVKFSSDGTRLLTGSADTTAREWDVATGRELARFEGHNGGVLSVDYHPTQPFIATASDDGSVAIWDRDSRQIIDRFALGEPAHGVAFSPDGRRLLGLGASQLWVWPFELEQRSPQEVERLVECKVPYRLEGAQVVATKTRDCSK